MHTNKRKLRPLMLAFAAVAGGIASHAQSADALIDKLVDKGILTVKEAKDLRQESDNGFKEAFQAKTGLADWVTSLKFSGDFRGRFEQNNAEDAAYRERDRFRYRLRVGVAASLIDQFDVGFRLASGNPFNGAANGGLPITANQDLNSLDSRKFIWIDAAYAKWTPFVGDFTLSGTIGKMDNPFVLSNMVWDGDLDPEGGALQASYKINNQHSIRAVGAFFVLNEINQTTPVPAGQVPVRATGDPYVYGGQLLFDSKWTPKIESSLGIAAFDIVNKDSLRTAGIGGLPIYNAGNTRITPGAGLLKYNMQPVIGTASLTYTLDSFPVYPDKFPIRVYGEYMDNPGAPRQNKGWRAGVVFGKAGKKKGWEVAYRYQRLEADAWYDQLVDDDNGALFADTNPQVSSFGGVGAGAVGWFGGTNVKGHLIQGTYSFTDFMNFTFTYYMNDLIINSPTRKSDAGHFMADVMWRF
jgi:hypothetical protein